MTNWFEELQSREGRAAVENAISGAATGVSDRALVRLYDAVRREQEREEIALVADGILSRCWSERPIYLTSDAPPGRCHLPEGHDGDHRHNTDTFALVWKDEPAAV